MIPSVTTSRYRLLILLLGSVAGVPAWAADSLLPYRDQIEQGYNARDPGAIEVVVTALKKAGGESDQEDLATYYAAFARLRQTAWEKELSPPEAASLALAWVAADRAACHGPIAEAAGALLDAVTEAPAA